MSEGELVDLNLLAVEHKVVFSIEKVLPGHQQVNAELLAQALYDVSSVDEILSLWPLVSRAFHLDYTHAMVAESLGLGKYRIHHFVSTKDEAFADSDLQAAFLDELNHDPFIKYGLNSSRCKIWTDEKSAGPELSICVCPWRHASGSFGLLKCSTKDESVANGLAAALAFIAPYLLENLSVLVANEGRANCKLLTERELSVLDCFSEGMAAQDVAKRLGISVHTVVAHTKNIYRKLGVKNRQQAIVRAREDFLRQNKHLSVA